MLVSYDNGQIKEVISYNELCDLVANQDEKEASGETDTFTFREVLGHQGPLKKSNSNYMGSLYNVKILWEDGLETWEPLGTMIAGDPITLATYAKDHGLTDLPGWKKLQRYT